MADGFLGFRTSFMLDFVVCALAAIVPALLFSIYLVKFKGKYVAHRNLQLGLAVILLIAVGAVLLARRRDDEDEDEDEAPPASAETLDATLRIREPKP